MYFEAGDDVEATEDEMNGFVQWLLHDFRDPATRRTPIEYFLQTQGARLNKTERELLQPLRDARFGLYEGKPSSRAAASVSRICVPAK